MIRKTLALGILFATQWLFAFPEMIRHGYANCMICHVSPNGGGILTPYGRGLSKEILSTWGTEDETKFLYGLVKPPGWLNLGGDARAIQTYLNSPMMEQTRFIFMQADLELAIQVDKWQLVGTLGRQEGSGFNYSGGPFFSRRHYLLYQPNEHLSFRAGKFFTAYGINLPDHFVTTRKLLRWDEGGETYNVEGAWFGSKHELFVTAVLGRPEAKSLNAETGVAIRPAIFINSSNKAGLGYYYGESDLGKRHLVGPFFLLGLTPHFFILAEADFQKSSPTGRPDRWGWMNYLRVNYEVMQGLHLFGTQEFARLDFKSEGSVFEAYTFGVQFFPRPHLEASAAIRKQRMLAQGTDFSDFAWLLLHFYL